MVRDITGTDQPLEVHLVSPDTGADKMVVAIPGVHVLASVAPTPGEDDLLIAFGVRSARPGGPSGVVRFDPRTGQLKDVIPTGTISQLQISPDGTQVAALESQANRARILLKSLTGGDWKTLTTVDGTGYTSLCWMPDGSLIFAKEASNSGSVLRVAASVERLKRSASLPNNEYRRSNSSALFSRRPAIGVWKRRRSRRALCARQLPAQGKEGEVKADRKLRILIASLVFAVVALAADVGAELFQKAVTQERAAGNLDEAIKLYQRVAGEFASNRPLAAKALVQEARCYEKLGQDKAVKLYQQVARDFGDQPEQAAAARERLAALGAGAKPKTGAAMVAHQIPLPATAAVLAQSDGKHVFYVDYQAGGLVAANMDGTSPRVILPIPANRQRIIPSAMSVSPDGRKVAALLTDAPRPSSYFVAATDGSGVHEVYVRQQAPSGMASN